AAHDADRVAVGRGHRLPPVRSLGSSRRRTGPPVLVNRAFAYVKQVAVGTVGVRPWPAPKVERTRDGWYGAFLSCERCDGDGRWARGYGGGGGGGGLSEWARAAGG